MKKFTLYLFVLAVFFNTSYNSNAQDIVDPTTLDNKIMAGYQGWFNAAGDGSGYGWIHWSHAGAVPAADNITFDMWPDLREYDEDELFETNFVYSNLSNAGLYSAYTKKTVDRHVKWMKDYGIDGVFVQRFLSSALARRDQRDTVLQNVRYGAEKYGRVFANMYDMSGAKSTVLEDLKNDWIHLVDDLKITESPNYLHHNGMPVLSIWGFNVGGSKDVVDANIANQIVQWFTVDAPEKYRVTLKGGVNDDWRSQSAAWQDVYDKLDIISPWAVGRYNNATGADTYKSNVIEPDLTEATSRNIDYIPVVFPGFSWVNLYGEKFNHIKRDGGKFLWRQFYNAVDAGVNMIYVAMYDEVDEGTAIYKLAENDEQTPTTGQFVTLDIDGYELPSDWYLRLTAEGTKMLRGDIALNSDIPIVAYPNDAEFLSQEVPTIMAPLETLSVTVTLKNTGTTNWTKSDNFELGYTIYPDTTKWGLSRIELEGAETIAPGDDKTFTFDITAPAQEGVYEFQWKMIKDDLEWIGDASDRRYINVSNTVDLLDDCDATTEWTSSGSLSLNSAEKKQGSGSLEFSGNENDTTEFQKIFSTPYNSGISDFDATLQFWYYISDASAINENISISLGSAGAEELDVYSWTVDEIHTGWNLITLNTRDALVIGSPDLDAINWFQLNNSKSGTVTTRIDEMQIFDRFAGKTKYSLSISNGEGSGNYAAGTILDIKADQAPAAQYFIGWSVDSSDILVEDIYAESTSINMPARDAVINAEYKILGIYLDDCDLVKDWGSAGSLSLNTEDQKEGLACIEYTGSSTDEYKKIFSTPYNSGATPENAKLEFWYYVSDVSAFDVNNQVELGSAGGPDEDEYSWSLSGLTNGWNFISLNISDAGIIGEPDLSAINWFRIYHFKTAEMTTRIDAIAITDPNAGERSPLTVYNGSGDGNYYSGTEVTITADNLEGKLFDHWEVTSGSASITDVNAATTTVVTSAEASVITAVFNEVTYPTLTINNGTPDGEYAEGDKLIIYADPAPEGKIFDKWVIESGSPVIANINASNTFLTMPGEDVVITATYIDDPSVSTNNLTRSPGFNIYPNPARSEIFVVVNNQPSSEINITLLDISGRRILQNVYENNLKNQYQKITIPVSDLDEGTYLINVQVENLIHTELIFIR